MTKNGVIEFKVDHLIPEWLTVDFVEKHLKNYYKNDGLKIVNFEVKPGSTKGIGLLSSMYQVGVSFTVFSNGAPSLRNEITDLNLMIKVAIEDEFALETLTKFGIYSKEFEFYREIAPKMTEKLLELDEPQLIPECFGVCKANNITIMEDLSAKGYGILPTQRGYTLPESKAILKKMAIFHAISAVLQEEHPNIYQNLQNGRLSRCITAFDEYHLGNFDLVLATIDKSPDFEVYSKKLHRIRDNVAERWHRAYDVNPSHFNALNHDDLFSPNLMIKLANSEDDFENVIIIDFQFVYWSSPTTDLHHFLNTSVQEDERPNRFDELVEHYHGHLENTLQRLKYTKHIPTLTEFFTQYRDRYFSAFVSSCLLLPVLAYNNEHLNVEELLRCDEEAMKAKRRLFQGQKVQELLRKTVPYFDKLGIFD